jgi:hypothetical protein
MAGGLELVSKDTVFSALIRYYPGNANAALRDMARMELSKARKDMLAVNRLINRMRRGEARSLSAVDDIGKGLRPDDPYAVYGARYTRALKCSLRLGKKIKMLEQTIQTTKGDAHDTETD